MNVHKVNESAGLESICTTLSFTLLTARNFINYYFAQTSYCTEVAVIANDKNEGIEV
jgi:hypothetical protein